MDNGSKLNEHVLLHRIHLRPVLDVRTIAQFGLRTSLAESVVYAALVYLVVVNVWLVCILVLNVGSSCDNATVGSSSCDRACVHKGYE